MIMIAPWFLKEKEMFKWIKNKVETAILSSQEREINGFIRSLEAISDDQIGLICAMASNYRNAVLETEIDLLSPVEAEKIDPLIAFKIGRKIKEAQRKDPAFAVGWFVWLHTIRAANSPELVSRGKLMWRHLLRGFDHVDDQADDFELATTIELNLSGSCSFPKGLNPFED